MGRRGAKEKVVTAMGKKATPFISTMFLTLISMKIIKEFFGV